MDQGFTTRPRFDQAQQALETAQARLEDAEARVETAQDRLGFTELGPTRRASSRRAAPSPGEVVQPGQMIVRLARDDGRDAVFDVPASAAADRRSPTIADPRRARRRSDGHAPSGACARSSPQADPVTRTFRVRVGLDNPPEAMRLGSHRQRRRRPQLVRRRRRSRRAR